MSELQNALARLARHTPMPGTRRWRECIPVVGSVPVGCGVYLITDMLEKRVYVGSSIRLEKRYRDHCARLAQEVWPAKLNGRWKFRVLQFFNSQKEAFAFEKQVIRRLNSKLTLNRQLYISHPYVPTGKPRGRPRKGQ